MVNRDSLRKNIIKETFVSLSRNIAGFNFPNKLYSVHQSAEIIDLVDSILFSIFSHKLIYMKDATEFDKKRLIFSGIASPALTENQKAAVITNEIGDFYVILNDMDHIKMVSRRYENELDDEFKLVTTLDSELSKKFTFSFDNNLGYLTSSPTLLGTGLKAKAKIFLIATVKNDHFERILQVIDNYNLVLLSHLDTNTSVFDYIYEITNKSCINVTEDEIINTMKKAISDIERIEQEERFNLIGSKQLLNFEDEVKRAIGIFTNASILTYEEFVRLNANIQLASLIGMVNIPLDDLLLLEEAISPISLCQNLGNSNYNGNNEERASFVARFFKERI